MSQAYLRYYGFKREPFIADIPRDELLKTPMIKEVQNRIEYVIRLGSIGLITGDVGCGKSTALRQTAGELHPSKYKVLWITGSAGPIMEFYRKVMAALGLELRSMSKAIVLGAIKKEIRELVLEKRQQPVIFIDEANLLRLDVFAELHTLTQFEADSKPWLPLIMAGQEMLIDKFLYQSTRSMASRVVAKLSLEAISQEELRAYIQHHLEIAGIKKFLFSDQAVTAIHRESRGLYRKSNHLSRGALIAAAFAKTDMATEEHVRLAATELM